MRTLAFSISFLIVAASFTGCSSSSEGKPEEIPSSEAANLDASQESLFQTAQQLYQKGLYSVATDSYTALKNGYPVGPYAEFAELKLADAEFNAGTYEAAALKYESFMKDHPASKSVPYVTYKAARSHQLSNRGIGRDPSPLHKAVELYDRLFAQYPESIYSSAAKEHRHEALEQLALYEKMVTDFYEFQEKNGAYQARNANFNEKWAKHLEPSQESPQEGAAAYALNLDAEPKAQLAVGAPQIVAALRSNQAESVPDLKTDAGKERTQAATTAKKQVLAAAQVVIKCKQQPAKMVMVHLKNSDALEEVRQNSGERSDLKPIEGSVAYALPGGPYQPITKNCFGHQDLTIDQGGTLSIKSSQAARIMAVDNPPRIMLIWPEE